MKRNNIYSELIFSTVPQKYERQKTFKTEKNAQHKEKFIVKKYLTNFLLIIFKLVKYFIMDIFKQE